MERFYGNAQVQETLHQMLKRDRAAHGFLFYGEAGLGKKTLAKRFLAELLCTGAEKPCGVCKSCRMLADGVHPDVRFVEHSGKRGGFSVDTVREVCMDLASPPNEGDAKCYVFGDCDHMDTRTQNLLLKAVEEPPTYGYFILRQRRPRRFCLRCAPVSCRWRCRRSRSRSAGRRWRNTAFRRRMRQRQ